MRKPPKWLRPAGIEREYVIFLRSIARQVQDALEQAVVPVLGDLRMDGIDDIPESTGWYERLRLAFRDASGATLLPGLSSRVAAFAARVSEFNQRQWQRLLRSVYGVDIFNTEPWLVGTLGQFEAENLRLIRSIPQQALDKLHGKIVQAVRTGKPAAELKKIVRSEYGATVKRAELIARDQIGKLNGQLTGERQKRTGVQSYKWRGSLDERERDEHVTREGQTFRWDAPPPDGHPGEPIRCRCWAEPVLPLLEDLEGLVLNDQTPERGFSRTRRGTTP